MVETTTTTTTKADEKETIKNLTNLTTGNLVTFRELCYPKSHQNASVL